MLFQKTYSIVIFWDSPRSGTADFKAVPHYFECPFDHGADDYSDDFRLYPVGVQFMERELQRWAIFLAWEARFHRGLESVETHPAHGGLDANYDDLTRWLDEQIKTLKPISGLYKAAFRPRRDQEALPAGVAHELEVSWTLTSG